MASTRTIDETIAFLEDVNTKLNIPTVIQLGPFGSMLGNIVHTNEVMVLLGDNYFLVNTPACAIDVLERRKDSMVVDQHQIHEFPFSYSHRMNSFWNNFEDKWVAPVTLAIDDPGATRDLSFRHKVEIDIATPKEAPKCSKPIARVSKFKQRMQNQ